MSPAATLRRPLPMLAASAAPFDDQSCIFEVKYDGVRALAAIEGGAVRVWGREGVDYSGRYPEVEAALRQLPAGTVVDGELVMIREGRPDFHALMRRHARRPGRRPRFTEPARYVVFDLLHHDGTSLVRQPLSERRARLHEVLPDDPVLALCEGVVGDGRRYFAEAIAAGHEGVVAKRLTSRYEPNRRSGAWQKIKRRDELACVVIGYAGGADGPRLYVASLVQGSLAYVGMVELGVRGGPELVQGLDAERRREPFVPCSAKATWVEPRRCCLVRFAGWRPGGSWRDASLVRWVE